VRSAVTPQRGGGLALLRTAASAAAGCPEAAAALEALAAPSATAEETNSVAAPRAAASSVPVTEASRCSLEPAQVRANGRGISGCMGSATIAASNSGQTLNTPPWASSRLARLEERLAVAQEQLAKVRHYAVTERTAAAKFSSTEAEANKTSLQQEAGVTSQSTASPQLQQSPQQQGMEPFARSQSVPPQLKRPSDMAECVARGPPTGVRLAMLQQGRFRSFTPPPAPTVGNQAMQTTPRPMPPFTVTAPVVTGGGSRLAEACVRSLTPPNHHWPLTAASATSLRSPRTMKEVPLATANGMAAYATWATPPLPRPVGGPLLPMPIATAAARIREGRSPRRTM